MKQTTLTVAGAAVLEVANVSGDLQVVGWERPEVTAKADGESLTLISDGQVARTSSDSDLIVYAPREIQIQRLMARDGIDRRTAEQTVAAQMDVEEKKKKARYVIDNSGTIDETREQVEKLFNILRA